MEKKLPFFVLALLLSLALIACGSSGGGDDELTAPDMGSPSDIPSSGAAAAPADQAAALTLFEDGMGAFGTAFSSNATASRLSSRVTQNISETINWVDTGISFTGSITGTATFPDFETFVPAPSTTYNDIIKIVMALAVNGTIDEASFTEGGITYVLSGKMIETLDFDYSLDFRTNAASQLASGSLGYSFGVAFGAALAIRNVTADVGAKFIISFADSMADSVSLTDMDALAGIDTSFLDDGVATLTVYNDANEQIFQETIPLSEIENVDPGFFLPEE